MILGRGNADSTAGTYRSTAGWNYAEEVCYPFGFGLSYTTFDYRLDSFSFDSQRDVFIVKASVTNTGRTDGKASVQVYAQSPYTDYDRQNKVEKAAVQLMNYDKGSKSGMWNGCCGWASVWR